MNLNFHTLALDRVFTQADSGAPAFHPAPWPTEAEVADALAMVRDRVRRLLVRRGLDPSDEAPQGDGLAHGGVPLAGIGTPACGYASQTPSQ